ncbi:hypothetical protein PMI30_03490 [Pseudomonas sp. GM50]|nr:hypothetical protein PMI30_03490 [Pseudomonas sp. GM50]
MITVTLNMDQGRNAERNPCGLARESGVPGNINVD